MAVDDTAGALLGRRPRRISHDPVTAKVVRVDGGRYVVALDDDERHPIGPCRGPEVAVGDVVLVIWTANDLPWIAQVDVS